MADSDLWLNNAGDLVISNGDLMLSDSFDAITQSIAFRLKTLPPELFLHPAIGTELDTLIGLPMTEDLMSDGEAMIYQSLTFDGLIPMDQVKVTGVPINANEAVFVIEVFDTELDRERTLAVPFDFQTGTVLTDSIHEVVGSTSITMGGSYG